MNPLKLNELKKIISETSHETSIYLGCDSQRAYNKKDKLTYINFARVVVVHIDSKHGCMVFGDKKQEVDYTNSVRYRMMQEVYWATELAMNILECVGDRNFEFHLDINKSDIHKSNAAMKEALGYVLGMTGIEAKIKPSAPAASFAADRFTHI